LEKHFYSIVFEHLAARELLLVDQFRFCPGKFTLTALIQCFTTFFNYWSWHLPCFFRLEQGLW